MWARSWGVYPAICWGENGKAQKKLVSFKTEPFLGGLDQCGCWRCVANFEGFPLFFFGLPRFIHSLVLQSYPVRSSLFRHPKPTENYLLGGGFKYFVFSSLFEEDEPNLTNIFQRGWNHQLACPYKGIFELFWDSPLDVKNHWTSKHPFNLERSWVVDLDVLHESKWLFV